MKEPRELRVLPVTSKSELKQFIAFPNALFASDPSWVPPLDLERRLHLSSKTNPYFKHARWQAWIAWRGDTPVGRICAQIDELTLAKDQVPTGFFGMLDAEDKPAVFAALLNTAESWLKENGIQRVQGPFSLSINDEVGILTEGFETPPMFMMGHARPYYGPYVEHCGYTTAKELLAYIIGINEFKVPKVMEWLLSKATEEITVRPLNLKNFDEELILLRDIFNDAWSDNWGYVPFTEEEFKDLGHTLKLLVAPELIQIAEVDGKAAAFIVALPNLNEVIRRFNGHLLPFGWAKLLWKLKVSFPQSARVPLMGVRREYHNTLGPALAFLAINAVKDNLAKRGVEKIEMSWILEDNAGVRSIIESVGSRIYKRYRVYEKSL